MISQDRKIRPIYGHTLRQLIDTKDTDVCYMYLFLMLMEREDHTVDIPYLKSEYSGLGWTPERIDKAINMLVDMGMITYAFEADEETGLAENRNEVLLLEMVDTLSEVTARISKWVLNGDIQYDAKTFEKEEYDDEVYTYDERKSMDVENKVLFENLSLKIQNDSFFVFEVNLNDEFVSFVPVDSVAYGVMVRNSEHMRFMKVDEMNDSVVVGLLRRLVHLSGDDVILAMYDSGNYEDNSSYPTIGIFKDSDGGSIPDTHCKYIVGVDGETAKRLMETEEEYIEGFTYFRGFLDA